MATSTYLFDVRLAELEAPPIDPTPEASEIFLDRLRMENCALDRLRHGLAVEDHLVAAEGGAGSAV